MNKTFRDLLSIVFSLAILGMSLYIIHGFLLPLAWAATIAIATFPFYLAWRKLCGRFVQWSAFSFTLLVALVIALPLSTAFSLLFKELHAFFLFLIQINKTGLPIPLWLQNIPLLGPHLSHFWDTYLTKPHGINELLVHYNLHLKPAGSLLSQIGMSVVGRFMILFFFLLSLFFMYRDGNKLIDQMNLIGHRYLGQRWIIYAHKLPAAIRATVNGTIFVGLGVGALMALSYSAAHIGAPVLLGFATALLAMIPFGAPLVFLSVATVIFAQGHIVAAILISLFGFLVLFIADHMIKPFLIGNATRLHFLAVLFGILGGVESLGLIGLFVGPIVMVLLTTWWSESQKHPFLTE